MLKSREENENVTIANFRKCLGMAVTKQNYIHVNIKSRLNSESACYHSF
jgi:hypothetical protein